MRLLYFNFTLTILFILLLNDCLAQTSRLGESSTPINERRIALVIGVNDYEHIRPLKNPVNDADDIAETLETLGFGVTKIKNQTHGQLTASVNKFINGLRANDVVMFYFSGHGIGYLDDNYLLPNDARIECLEQISAYSISVKRLTADIQSKKVRNCFVILDACRSMGNLYACNDSQSAKDLLNTQGFVIPQNQSRGNIIVYATQAGQTAEDNPKKRNGLFTQELLKNIIIPDLTFGAILNKTAVGVVEESKKLNSYQEPIVYGLIGTDFIFLKNGEGKTSNTNNLLPEGNLYSKAKKLYTDKKYEEAFHVFKKLAEQGDAAAQSDLGLMYENGKGIDEDFNLAYKWYKASADQGNSDGQFNLGSMYVNARFVEQNYKKAIELFEKSVKQNNPEGMVWLGSMYDYGKGVDENKKIAFDYYLRAGNLGSIGAASHLGEMYYLGKGVEINNKESLKWFKKAAENGNGTAQASMSLFYLMGKEVPINVNEARSWIEKSIENKSSYGYFLKAQLLEKGVGYKKDMNHAVVCYQESVKLGNTKAQDRLNKLDIHPEIVSDSVVIAEYFNIWDDKSINPYGEIPLFKTFNQVTLPLFDKSKGRQWSSPMFDNFRIRSGKDFVKDKVSKGLIFENKNPAVYAAFDGVIRVVLKNHPIYKNVVVIRHYNGLESIYSGFEKINYETNTLVKAGDEIGSLRINNLSKNYELYFEIDYGGKAIDPMLIYSVNKNAITIKKDTLILKPEMLFEN